MAETSTSNDRGFYRVRDRVALKIKSLPNIPGQSASRMFEDKRREMGIVSQFLHEREMQRPNLKSIEKSSPEVARYISHLEDKLQRLAQHIQGDNQGIPEQATHTIDLSASGLSIDTSYPLQPDDMVEISMRLFPSLAVVYVLGMVVRNEAVTVNSKPTTRMAIRFTHLHEDDEEMLIKHIHQIQMDGLKVVVN